MKTNKSCMAWLIVIFIIAPGTVFLINLLFFPENKVREKHVDDYISNSSTIKLDMTNNAKVYEFPYFSGTDKYSDCEFDIRRVYTGLKTAFLRGKLTGKIVREMNFFNNDYQKYFSFAIIPEKRAQSEAYYAFIRKSVLARVNNYEMNSPDYGTRNNPVHIFMLEIPELDHPNFSDRVITEDQYRRTVLFYLTYMMPKKEFKGQFKG